MIRTSTWVCLAMAGGWISSGCNLGLGGSPEDARNRLQEELAAIVPIAPRDTSKAFLDSATLSFSTRQTNVFEYEGVLDKSLGGMGPFYEGFRMTVKSTPLDDSLLLAWTGTYPDSGRIALPPSRYRRDSLPPTGMGTGRMALKVFPYDSRAPWGLFVADDGRRMLYLTESYASWPGTGTYTKARLLYLEPYGLIYARVDDSPRAMETDYLEMWLTRWNGDTLDRQAIFGMAKGLLGAYPAGGLRPPPLTP